MKTKDLNIRCDNWEKVDLLLKDVKFRATRIQSVSSESERQITQIRENARDVISAFEQNNNRDLALIEDFVRANKDGLDGKSKKLKFGTVGLRTFKKFLWPKKISNLIALLEKYRSLRDFVRVKKSVDKEAFSKDPRIDKYVKSKQEEKFYYDLF